MMFKLLLKKQLLELFRGYFYDAKRNRGRSKGVTILLFLLFAAMMIGIIGVMFGSIAAQLCPPMVEAGVGWLYYVVMTVISVAFGIFGSVFTTFSTLYIAKDNDLLLSLPIPVWTVVGSRITTVYLMGLMYTACIFIPAIIVRAITPPAPLGCVLGGVVLLALLSIFVLTLSCLLGWVVAKASLKLKNKGVVTALAAVLGIGLYYLVYFKAMDLIRDLVQNAAFYGEKIHGSAYWLYLVGLAGEGDGKALAICAAVVLALFGVTWLILKRTFLRIATATGVTKKRAWQDKPVKRKSVSGALLGKEFARFLSSPGYMLNCGLGILLLPPIGVLLLVKGGLIFEKLAQVFGADSGVAPVLLCATFGFLSSMIDPVVPSVSLEGKNLWVVKSLPVTPWQVLWGKLNMHLLLCGIPMLFAAVCAAAVMPGPAVERVLVVLLAMLNVLLSAFFGLFLGLKMPNLRWTNEMTVIKQSAGVLISIFGSGVYFAALAGLYLWKGGRLGAAAYLGICCGVAVVLSAALFVWLKKRGTQIFAAL